MFSNRFECKTNIQNDKTRMICILDRLNDWILNDISIYWECHLQLMTICINGIVIATSDDRDTIKYVMYDPVSYKECSEM